METIDILKIIKRKLFEPRKKIVYNTSGKKVFSDNHYCIAGLQHFDENDEFIDVCNGWNVADKDYVNFKIQELASTLSKDRLAFVDTSGTASGSVSSSKISGKYPKLPSAPFEELTEPQKFKTMIYLKGTKDTKSKKYVFDTLLLKEGSVINEKHIYVQKQFSVKDTVVLNSLKRDADNKKIPEVKSNFIQMKSLKKGDKTNILSCMDEEQINEQCTIGFDIDFKTEDELGDISMQLYITTY